MDFLVDTWEKTLVTGGPADRHYLGLRASQCPAPDPAEFAVGAGGAKPRTFFTTCQVRVSRFY